MNFTKLQETSLIGKKLLTISEINDHIPKSISNMSIILETGKIVKLLDNYKDELILYQDKQHRSDDNWLTNTNGIMCFNTRHGDVLPVIIDLDTSSCSESKDKNSSSLGDILETCIFILDTSASMGGGRGHSLMENIGKLGAAKHIIRKLINNEPLTDYKVLPFDQTGRGGRSISPTTQDDLTGEPWYISRPKNELNVYLNSLQAIGGTPLFEKTTEGLKKAIEIAKTYELSEQRYKVSVIILTDGIATDHQYTEQAKEAVSEFLALDELGNPKYSCDIEYYYAGEEGGEGSGVKMGIPSEKLLSFHNNESGIESAGVNMISRRMENRVRMSNTTLKDFKLKSRIL